MPNMAQAASDSMVRIAESGRGFHKRLKLGLNKALVVDLPADAHDILVADPSMADAVTRTSRRIYLFGKSVGQTNIFIFGRVARKLSASIWKSSAILMAFRAICGAFCRIRYQGRDCIRQHCADGHRAHAQDAVQVKAGASLLQGGEATTRNTTATGGQTDGGVAIYAETRQKCRS